MTTPNIDTPVMAPQMTQDGTESPSGTETTREDSSAAGNRADESGRSGNSEAAKYRRQLRDAEEERDALASRVESHQRREVEQLAGALAQPGDLFTLGDVTVADLLDENGEIDAETVAAKVAELLESRPGLAANARIPAAPTYPNYGQGASPFNGRGTASHSWHAALKRG
jgi:hypothetical protein